MGDRLRGKVVAITGAGRGIGLATARALAARGARVGIGDLDADLAVAAAASLPGAFGSALDVRDKADFAAGHIPNARNIPLPELGGRLRVGREERSSG